MHVHCYEQLCETMADELPTSNNTSPSMEIQVSDDHCIEQVEKIKQELDVIKEDIITQAART